ncbi:hypothetical protein D2962_03935 [Biomaibacter acetigenes]|uniref:Uncharacterized protein n=1 Tax=Biomaibacter acetigenes TaxID=2316383 RepID=A0A3G2R424_9FIRM|nr:hypothetical protein [Biomaibacter acetigenes]AYO29868.1 hypothetical protein D2962_03935 [Biomaibacter acetigenes]
MTKVTIDPGICGFPIIAYQISQYPCIFQYDGFKALFKLDRYFVSQVLASGKAVLCDTHRAADEVGVL